VTDSGIALTSTPAPDLGIRAHRVGRFVVPAGGASSAAFVVDHLYVAHSLRERLAWPIHRATGGRALVKVADPSGLTAASRAAIAMAAGGLPGAPGRVRSWIVETDYPDRARDRSIVFVFADDPRRPALVIKRARASSNGESPSLARERDTLTALRRVLPEALARTVPQVLAHDVTDGWESLALAWLPGRSGYAEMHTRIVPAAAVAAHFRNAASWLARFHDATRVPERVLGPAQLLDAVSGLETSARAVDTEWFAKLCDSCDHRPVQTVTSHGDYWARNVLFVRSRTSAVIGGVVDWEHSCAGASPFDDVFHFALTYGLSYPWSRYRRANPVEAFGRTFLDENRVSRGVRQYLRAYCRERGLDANVLALWFRCFLLARAVRAASQRALWIRFDEMIGAAGRSVFSG
jgi:hypothetical protein